MEFIMNKMNRKEVIMKIMSIAIDIAVAVAIIFGAKWLWSSFHPKYKGSIIENYENQEIPQQRVLDTEFRWAAETILGNDGATVAIHTIQGSLVEKAMFGFVPNDDGTVTVTVTSVHENKVQELGHVTLKNRSAIATDPVNKEVYYILSEDGTPEVFHMSIRDGQLVLSYDQRRTERYSDEDYRLLKEYDKLSDIPTINK